MKTFSHLELRLPRWVVRRSPGQLLSAFISVLLFVGGSGQAQIPTIRFAHVGTDEGLSHGNVYSILQDHLGFMWFGTIDGLNRFDGYRFTVYRNDPANPASISNNHIVDIKEDRQGNLWLATQGGGLNKWDRQRNTFTRYQHRESDPRSLSSDFVNSLICRSDGTIWVGTKDGLDCFNPQTGHFARFTLPQTTASTNKAIHFILEDAQHRIWLCRESGGLDRLDLKTHTFTHFQHDPADEHSLSSNSVYTLLEDTRHRLWIGTQGGGLNSFDPKTGKISRYEQHTGPDGGQLTAAILALEEDLAGNIWVGTENEGLLLFNPDTKTSAIYRHDEVDHNSLSNNSIHALRRDVNGNMWLGIYSSGINLVNREGNKFIHYKHTAAAASLNHNVVLAFFEASDSTLWLGTDGGGMSRFDRRRGTFTPFVHDDKQPNSVAGNYVLSIAEDSHKNLWIGTWNDGLSVYDRQRNVFKQYRRNPLDPNSLSGNNVYSMLHDRDDIMWLATWGGGLNRYDPAIDGFRHYKHDPANPNTICSNELHHIMQDSRGYLWIGSADAGLDRFDPKTGQFTHFTHQDGRNSLSNNNVSSMYEDHSGNIWVTTNTGLNCYNPVTKHFTNYYTKDGLPNDVTYGVLEDEKGNFWVSTNGGLSRFDPRTGTFLNFTAADGLQANEFKQQACLKTHSGQLYFGGTNGFNIISPATLHSSHFDPPLLLTNLLIFNKEVFVAQNDDDDSPLKRPVYETNSITLPYASAVITIEFASLNYTVTSKKKYAYRLAGFDKDWNYVGTTRTATYTNLNPGQYTFEVKGLDSAGKWSTRNRSLTITIEPPYFLAWWFKMLVIGLLLGLVFLGYHLRMRAIFAQKSRLEEIIAERTERLQQEQVLNRMKSQFVSTTSHEFRTPLTTIQSSVDLVALYIDYPPEQAKAGIQKHLGVIRKEIGKFNDLLNDVLSIEKMGADKVTFAPKPLDVAALCHEIIATHFQVRTDGRTVIVSLTGEPRSVRIDEKLLNHALVNLLSNAFKFSRTNPALHITFGNHLLTLAVTDEGVGIPSPDMPHLFETFFRAGNVAAIQGTGLGLFIARQSVLLHGGTIAVTSQENRGTTFTITLPADPVPEEVGSQSGASRLPVGT